MYGNGIAECVSVTLGGRGYHMNELSPDTITISLKSLFAAALSWTFSTSAIKVSLLLLYIRVFPQRPFRYTAYGLMVVVALYCIGCVIFYVGNCRPIEANWIHGLPGSTCGNQQAGWLGTGIANIITDVAILSLPMRSVWHLQLPRRTKTALVGIFGIGFITVIVSIVRLVTLLQINLNDFTYDAVPADIFSAFEPTLMITCACMPIMRPLFRRMLPTNTRSRYGRSHNRDRASMFASNRGNKNGDTVDMHMKHIKSKETPSKHRSIVLPGSDGFYRLPDVESKLQSSSSSEATPTITQGPLEKPANSVAAVSQSRTQSPAFGRKEKDRGQTPTLPMQGIEVTREWTVELE